MKIKDNQLNVWVHGEIFFKKVPNTHLEGFPLDLGALFLKCGKRNIILDGIKTNFETSQDKITFDTYVVIDKTTFPKSKEYNYNLEISDLIDENLEGTFYVGDEPLRDEFGTGIDEEKSIITVEFGYGKFDITLKNVVEIGG